MLTNNNKGFTLIEVLVALFILVTITFAVIHLITRSQQVAGLAQENFVAVNIAREGLELVRATRDTQWFQDPDRANWIPDTMCGGNFTLDAVTVRSHATVFSSGDGALYIADNGEWTHALTNTPTPYKRTLAVDCSNKDGDPSYVTVSATVTWVSRGQARNVVLKEKLYNWLQ